MAGDWTGTGRDNIGDFNGGVWHLDLNNNGLVDAGETFNYGGVGDKPVVGDWNGNGIDKLGVFRAAVDGITGLFILDINNNRQLDAGDMSFTFGAATDRIVVGDWTGDKITKVGVFRDAAAFGAPGAAVFTLDTNNNHAFDAGVDQVFIFGLITDGLVIGDWNGTGVSKVGVYRDGGIDHNAPGTALFSLDINGNRQYDSGVDSVFLFGLTTDQFVGGNWVVTPPVRPALTAAGGTGPGGAAELTNAELAAVLQQAIANWTATGVNTSGLSKVKVSIGHLDGALLGSTGNDGITLDADAAGWGWYTSLAPSVTVNQMDLLTVVEHELGHELGFSDLDAASHPGDIMVSSLPPGIRRNV